MSSSKSKESDPQSVKSIIDSGINPKFIIKGIPTELYEEHAARNKDSDFKDSTPIPQIKKEALLPQASFDMEDEEGEDGDDAFSKPINSAFDINLAEFPIAYLNRGSLPKNANKTEIRYTDTIKGRDGKPVTRYWTVQANGKISGTRLDKEEKELGRKLTDEERTLGFGGPQTLEVIYELFQLWKEQGFKESKIHVGNYYHLLKRLGWGTGKSNYEVLYKTLECIHGIRIIAEKAVYLPSTDEYVDMDFYIFPEKYTYSKNEKKIFSPNDYLCIVVGNRFFEAVQSNTTYYMPFDRLYFKTLKPMEQKLALMLAKVFSPYRKNPRYEWKRSMEKLAVQIPILAEDIYQIKRQLKRTCEGLIARDFKFLSRYTFEGDNIIFYNNPQTMLNLKSSQPEARSREAVTVEYLRDEQLKVCKDKHSKNFYTLVAKVVPEDIIYRCLSEAKQEGKDVKKLYTKLILERADDYLKPYIKRKGTDDELEVSKDTVSRIEYEILKSKRSTKFSQDGENENVKEIIEDDPNAD